MKDGIIIGGDFFISDDCFNEVQRAKIDIWGDLLQVFKESELNIINCEAPITEHCEAINKTGPNLRMSPNVLDIFEKANIHMFSLANNHIKDFGEYGMNDTIQFCKNNNIDYLGLKEKDEELTVKVINKVKVGFLNFTENEWSTLNNKKINVGAIDVVDNYYKISKAKTKCDNLILIVHGGVERYNLPSPYQKKLFRYYIDAGADLVVGHHTHCYSGFEKYKDKMIFYSLGNLFFPSESREDMSWFEGFLLKLNFEEKKITWALIPYQQCSKNLKIKVLKNNANFLTNIRKLNRIIENENSLNNEWENFCLRSEKTFDNLLLKLIPSKIAYKIILKFNLQHLFLSKDGLKYMLNIIRCESYYTRLVNYLNKKYKDNYD